MTSALTRWVLDIGSFRDGGPYVFCPIADDGSILVGMSYLSDEPPGRLVGVFEEGMSDEQVDAWCDAHAAFLHVLMGGEPI